MFKRYPFSFMIGAGVLLAATFAHGASSGKLIQLGWDQPSTEYIRDHWQAMDETAPFDGITLAAEFTYQGRLYNDYSVMSGEKWPREALEPALKNLQAARFKHLKHNFVRINTTPGNLDWFNDAQWEAAIGNVANIAWLTKEAGLKGICFDPEQYQSKQYNWQPKSGRSFGETYAKARERGAQMMRAMTKEYPDITLWSLWLFSKTLVATPSGEVLGKLSYIDYGLWPAFINGWLDALPPGAKLVEGMEDGYYFQQMDEFPEAYTALRNVNSPLLADLLAPENRVKYQTQVSISFGIYLDAYLNDDLSSSFYLGPLRSGTRIDRMRETLGIALSVADDYVWLYNEQVKWWPIDTLTWREGGTFLTAARKHPGKGRLAEEAVPGITQAVNLARDPQATGEAIMAQKEKKHLKNLLVNGDFSNLTPEEKRVSPEGWWTWQRADSKGSFEQERLSLPNGETVASACFSGIAFGTLGQGIKIKQGKAYYLQAWVRQVGNGGGSLAVRWQTGDGKWGHLTSDLFFNPEPGSSKEEWRRISGVLTAPEGVRAMVVLLSAGGQQTLQDRVWFKEVGVYELP